MSFRMGPRAERAHATFKAYEDARRTWNTCVRQCNDRLQGAATDDLREACGTELRASLDAERAVKRMMIETDPTEADGQPRLTDEQKALVRNLAEARAGGWLGADSVVTAVEQAVVALLPPWRADYLSRLADRYNAICHDAR